MRNNDWNVSVIVGIAAWMWTSDVSHREGAEINKVGSGEMTHGNQLAEAPVGVVGWTGELDDFALWRVLVPVVVAFALKATQGFIARKRGKAALLRTVEAHLLVARDYWRYKFLDQRAGKCKLAGLDSVMVGNGETHQPNDEVEGSAPFVRFPLREGFWVEGASKFLELLDKETIRRVVRFLRTDATARNYASGIRSECVRQQLAQASRVELLCQYSNEAARAYKAAEDALFSLASYTSCPALVWYMPLGHLLWSKLYRGSPDRPTGSDRRSALGGRHSKVRLSGLHCACTWTGLGCVATEDRLFTRRGRGHD